jgi:glycosyltransferase involved in cell wall biosynthesis
MTRPNVMLVAHKLATPEPTGIPRYVCELAKGLAELQEANGLAYTLCSAAEDTDPPWLPPGMGIQRLPGRRRIVHIAWTVLGQPQLERLVPRPDLVHVLSQFAVVPTHATLVHTVNDLTPLDFPDFYARSPRWAFRRSVEHAVRHAHSIITLSQRVADDVIDRFGVEAHRLVVVPDGVGPEFAGPFDGSTIEELCRRYGVRCGRFLLFVGETNLRKNLITVIRALDRAGNLPLLIAGPLGKGSDTIQAEVARLGLRDRVRWIGFVPGADLPTLMHAALALVHPAVYEGFGLTPLEAMAAGTPVVGSRGGAVPEVVGDAGVLVDTHDVEAWRSALERIVGDDALRNDLRNAGRLRAGEYTWRRTARETLAVHQAALAGS